MTKPARNLNNFDLLRLVFASMVFLHHSYSLTGDPGLLKLGYFFRVEFAINCFFVISGFLVFMSFDNSKSVKEYLAKRFRRIYPAYFSVIILCAFLGLFITDLSLPEYFSMKFIKYLAANLSLLNFIEPSLPGVFINNPIKAVNGALWTIRTEVMCYCLVPVIVILIRRFSKGVLFAIIYFLAYILFQVFNVISVRTGQTIFMQLAYIPWHFLCFLSGGIIYFNYSYFEKKARLLFLLSLFIYLGSIASGLTILKPISLAVLIIYSACFFYYLGNFGKYGDFSYGVYIFHFPIIQTLIYYNIFRVNPFLAFALSSAIILIISFISWHMIEKPFLKRSSHYVIANKMSHG